MSDLREIAAKALHEYHERTRPQIPEKMRPPRSFSEIGPLYQEGIMQSIDPVISAIEPELRKRHRAELYAELIAVASNTTAFEQVTFGWLYGVADGEPLDDEGTVADWLRSRQEAETDDR